MTTTYQGVLALAAVALTWTLLAGLHIENQKQRRLHDPIFDDLRWAAERVDYAGTHGLGQDLEALVTAVGEARDRGATITDIGGVIGATDGAAIERFLRRYDARTTGPQRVGGNR